MSRQFVKVNLDCPNCGRKITTARPLKLDQSGILTYTGMRHTIRFDFGAVKVTKCPKVTKVTPKA